MGWRPNTILIYCTIRRYPDLVIHRIIKDFLNGAMSKGRIKYLEKVLPGLSEHCSQREKLADEVERETDNLKKAEYMLDKIGMEFEGIISGVTYFGIFVALANTVEGLVRILLLMTIIMYNEKHYCLIGNVPERCIVWETQSGSKWPGDIPSRNIDFILA